MNTVIITGLIIAELYCNVPIGCKQNTIERHGSYLHIVKASEDLISIKEKITKDLHRTYLVADNKELQASLCRILLGIAYILPNITYCQGMNCIGATLLHVIKDEEVSFFMFLALIDQ